LQNWMVGPLVTKGVITPQSCNYADPLSVLLSGKPGAVHGALRVADGGCADQARRLARYYRGQYPGSGSRGRDGRRLHGPAEQSTVQTMRRLSQAASGTGPAVEALRRLRPSAEDLQAHTLDARASPTSRRRWANSCWRPIAPHWCSGASTRIRRARPNMKNAQFCQERAVIEPQRPIVARNTEPDLLSDTSGPVFYPITPLPTGRRSGMVNT